MTASRQDVNLKRQAEVEAWMGRVRANAILMPAAKIGGIFANDAYPAEFPYDNLMIQANAVEAALRSGVQSFLCLGSSCIYPKFAPRPITEGALLKGPLEPTNEWYAASKIAGIKLRQAYRRQYGFHAISAMPTNVYVLGDNFDLETPHGLPARLRKAREAKISGFAPFTISGTGSPRREFPHYDDCANGRIHLIKVYSLRGHVNIGSGKDITIHHLAKLVANIVSFDGKILKDPSKPDGTPRKLMSADRLRASGWCPRVTLELGVRKASEWYSHTASAPASGVPA